jgi:hypothetical protein
MARCFIRWAATSLSTRRFLCRVPCRQEMSCISGSIHGAAIRSSARRRSRRRPSTLPPRGRSRRSSLRSTATRRGRAKCSPRIRTDKPLQRQQLRDGWNEQPGPGTGRNADPRLGLKPVNLRCQRQRCRHRRDAEARRPAHRAGVRRAAAGARHRHRDVSSTEALMSQWLGQGLGFALNHIEEAFGNLFGLKGQPDEYIEFNTAALLRSQLQGSRRRARARRPGRLIFAPDEGRADRTA